MKRTFVCASSCIKHVQPFKWLPWDAHSCPYVCLYCANFFLNYKNVLGTRTKNIFKNEQKVGMLLQKRADTRGVGISNMRKSIYLLTTTPTRHTHFLLTTPTPTSHTHTFHPLSRIVIHTFNLAQVQCMDDNCGEWVECMGVVSRRWVWLVGVGVVSRK